MQRTQVELETCLYFVANLKFSLWFGSVQIQRSKGTQSTQKANDNFTENPVTKTQAPTSSSFPTPFIVLLIILEIGESNSHEFLIFCGPYAHVGIDDSWLSNGLTANILFPLFISKCAINLETTPSGRRVKASHRSCVIISVIVSWCCWTCCCKAEEDFHTFSLPPKQSFSWSGVGTSRLNTPQKYGSTESINVTTSPQYTDLSFPDFILPLSMFLFFVKYKKFWKDLKELYVTEDRRKVAVFQVFWIPKESLRSKELIFMLKKSTH